MSDKSLGIKINTSAKDVKTELNAVNTALKSVTKQLQSAGYAISGIKKIQNAAGNYKRVIVTAKNETETLRTTINRLGKTTGIQTITKQANTAKGSFSKMFSIGKIYAFWNMTTRIREGIKGMITSSIDFIETTNKFEVSMGNMEKSAYKFIDTISNRFGLAREELMNYQSTYNNIMKSLSGITDETAYKISESITEMAIDYASLYNVSTEEAMTKFQSALVGSVRPIRSESGYDITETTIGEKAKELGVDTPVRQLNQMEKRLLRIMVLMDQMKQTGAMGDFARTIEQPANQLKILQNQLKELGIWLGNVFMGTLGKIMPYINGFVMALKEMAKMLAIFVGYNNVGSIAEPFEAADDASDSVASNLGSAAASAKELKKTLMGFDVLNVIQTPSSGGGGGGSDLGIDPKILDAMKKYDNLMENVRMKAIDIRDKILQWLGFTWELDEEGNIINLRLKDGYTNLEKIRDIFLIIVGATVLVKLVKMVSSLVGFIGTIKGLIFGTQTAATTASVGLVGLFAKIKSGFETVAIALMYVKDWFVVAFGAGLGGVLTFLAGIVAPIAAAIWGVTELSKPIADLSTETLLFGENISDATKNAVQPFMDKMQELGTTIWGLELGGIVTKEDVNKVKAQTKEINRVLQKGIVDKYAELEKQVADVKLFPDVKKREEYLKLLKTSMEEEKNTVKFYNDKINEIVANAANQNRELTQLERVQIEEIRQQMANTGIETLSANQEEALAIKAKFNENFYKLEVQQVADAIKQAKELKDKSIEQAQKEYDEKIALAEKMKATVPGFSQEMYEQMTADAKTELDKQLKEARDTYDGIIKEAQEKYPEVTKTINLETGKIKNGWQVAGDHIKEKAAEIGNAFKTTWQSAKDGAKIKWEEIKKGFEDFKTKLNEKIDNIKKKWKEFKDNFTLPNIKTPHFNWSTTPATGWVKEVLEALNIPASLPKLSVSWYAQGGLPDVGEMFVAREAGPELVGTIGNKSAVVNNQQIVEAVSQGVAQAVSSVMGSGSGSYHLYIDGQEITDVVTKRMNRMANITGGYAYGQ